MDNPLLKYSAKDYFFKAALCHFIVDELNAKVRTRSLLIYFTLEKRCFVILLHVSPHTGLKSCGSGTLDKALNSQTCRPEFRCPAPIEKPGAVAHICDASLEKQGRDKRVLEACWPASPSK